jgi:hypothetical protein
MEWIRKPASDYEPETLELMAMLYVLDIISKEQYHSTVHIGIGCKACGYTIVGCSAC